MDGEKKKGIFSPLNLDLHLCNGDQEGSNGSFSHDGFLPFVDDCAAISTDCVGYFHSDAPISIIKQSSVPVLTKEILNEPFTVGMKKSKCCVLLMINNTAQPPCSQSFFSRINPMQKDLFSRLIFIVYNISIILYLSSSIYY